MKFLPTIALLIVSIVLLLIGNVVHGMDPDTFTRLRYESNVALRKERIYKLDLSDSITSYEEWVLYLQNFTDRAPISCIEKISNQTLEYYRWFGKGYMFEVARHSYLGMVEVWCSVYKSDTM